MTLTQARLKEVLHYNPLTGVFTWINPPSNRVSKGDIAGTVGESGYRKISIDGRIYRAHRLAFLYVLGYLPTCLVDNENTDKDDNRWENLREATKSTNAMNTGVRSRNKSGFKGVETTPAGTFRATICVNGKRFSLGTFKRSEDAHEAYKTAAANLHGAFARAV